MLCQHPIEPRYPWFCLTRPSLLLLRQPYSSICPHQSRGESQSLFHQVCVRSRKFRKKFRNRKSQSLFHQVCVRSQVALRTWQTSSRSQSLFHQVCVRSVYGKKGLRGTPGRNPFFIRSVFVHDKKKKNQKGCCRSQSLFHQVCVRSSHNLRSLAGHTLSQSLFHQVCVRSIRLCQAIAKKQMSQSLFHQVCVRSIAVYGDRKKDKSQSLFHQVCVRSSYRLDILKTKKVAIPFSSGLCSFMMVISKILLTFRRNPFFIRSVFVLVIVPINCWWVLSRNPFFIRSVFVLNWEKEARKWLPGRNPFFIRSVFVHGRPNGTGENRTGRNPFFIRSVFVPGTASTTRPPFRSQSLFHQVCVRSIYR